MIDPGHPRLSIVRQCELASISRSKFYRKPMARNEATLRLMRLIDEQFLETPWYGSRQMVRRLRCTGWCVGRHCVRRLMTKMGLADLPTPEDQRAASAALDMAAPASTFDHRPAQPRLVRGRDPHPDAQRLPIPGAVMDWFSRKVLALRLSNTMDAAFCVAALAEAVVRFGRPEIISFGFTNTLRLLTSASRWTAVAAGWTTSSSSGYGDR